MAFADDLLKVNRMNAKEGGCQSLMHDTIFEGKQIAMTRLARNRTGDYVRIPRGMMMSLSRGVVTTPKRKWMKRERSWPSIMTFEMKKKTSWSISFMNMAMLAYSSPSFIVKSTQLNAVGLRLNATPGHTAVITL